MHVTEHQYGNPGCKLQNHLLEVVYLWVESSTRVLPSSVKIVTTKISSVIPMDNTIGIEHGNYFEYEMIS